MFSLKHLLNNDQDDEESGRPPPRSFNLLYPVASEHCDVQLSEKSWGELWSELLGNDLGSAENMPPIIQAEENFDPTYNVEAGIEHWANQNFEIASLRTAHPDAGLLQEADASYELPDPDLVCYGMIHRVSVKVMGNNMGDIDSKIKEVAKWQTDNYYCFTLQKSAQNIFLQFHDGTNFALLNGHASTGLLPVVDLPFIQMDALGSLQSIRETLGRATKSSDATVRVEINVYGPTSQLKYVGDQLSDKKMFLQRPDRPRHGLRYHNPHLLSFAGLDGPILEHRAIFDGSNEMVSKDQPAFQKTITNVYASLTRGANLDRVDGDRRLTTHLLPHQEEALGFMLQRENGPVSSEYCLWAPVPEEPGWFRHAVTNAKSRSPSPEIGGGILADEMGMGKSLSVLALITKTIESSQEWERHENYDEDDNINLPQDPIRATLVLVPSAVLINEWLNEIKKHLDGSLRVLKYHGTKRKEITFPHISDADIVLTTYNTLVADYESRYSPLHKFNWYRVVLDEGHIIRRQTTKFNRAVSELTAKSRWCLTGTPIQNRLEDVGSLFAFIRVRPFHSLAMFRRFVSIPFDESQERRVIATRNLTLLLDSLCLRRSREILHLPAPHERDCVLEFSPEERDQYDNTAKVMNRTLRERVSEHQTNNVFGMFQIQLQLRILCNHGTYQHAFSWTKRNLLDEREDALCAVGDTSQVNCSVCRQSMPLLGSNNVYRRGNDKCKHILCSECLNETEESMSQPQGCPLCISLGICSNASGNSAGLGDTKDSYLKTSGFSTKMVALMKDIKHDLWNTKSIVFSCWTNTLNLIHRHLETEGILFQRIDGNCSIARRQRILDEFSSTPNIPVLIMTTGTCAFGLNLTAANRVFIIEPQWNPSVENQAIARAIRMNQQDSVVVTRYMIKGTVEQEMRSQQKRKLEIADIGINPSQ
ncbi:SNF2 family N-terminal domain-containing protein [Cadophora sp. MPI-SDFR-AT-0126]|nr:SNF2 family N-terminal domain-containing protein [Leotiomycetes sp. MPI-SDFR-AT-0126]